MYLKIYNAKRFHLVVVKRRFADEFRSGAIFLRRAINAWPKARWKKIVLRYVLEEKKSYEIPYEDIDQRLSIADGQSFSRDGALRAFNRSG